MMTQARVENGFILIMTLVCMMVFSLLILTMLQKLMFSSQLYEQIRTQHHTFYAMDLTADYLFHNIAVLKNGCAVAANDLSNIDDTWIEQKGCELTLENEKYHYLFASIGIFPCLQIATASNKTGSHHWWIILYSESQRHILLWMRVAVPEKQSLCHQKSLIRPIKNRLSWYMQRV